MDKKSNDNMQLAKGHFDKLKSVLEVECGLKNYVLIIEYLINFLGCLTLAALKNKSLEVSRNRNISDLTAGQWAAFIEDWATSYSEEKNLKALRSISCEFITTKDKTPSIKSNIRKWIELRNTLSHDVIMIDNHALDKLLKKNLFLPKESLDAFINSVLKIIEAHSDLVKSDFFHGKDNMLYIYAGLDREGVKYRHYTATPLIVTKTDFPLSYKEVFLSLAPTALDNLWEADQVKVQMTTTRSRLYENDIQLWVNGRLVTESFCRFSDGEIITFPLEGFPFEENSNNLIEVKALRKGRIQAFDEKIVRIYSLIPDIEIRWEGRGVQEAPTDKLHSARFSIQAAFGITAVHVDVMDEDGVVLDQNPVVTSGNAKKYVGNINMLSTRIGETEIVTRVTYADRRGNKNTKTTALKARFTPNFFEPNFEGAGRDSLIGEMVSQKGSWLITGEGGIGKSRLISEFLKKASRNYHEITITSSHQLTEQLASVIKIHFDKRDKGDDRRTKVMAWFQENACLQNGVMFWIKDCHEIVSDEERTLLKGITDGCCQPGSAIALVLESRDESWGENAGKAIKELQSTGVSIRRLNRLEKENLDKIINSVFNPNNFTADLKNELIERCDGIIYMLLEFLKLLYNSDYIKPNKNEAWTVKEGLDLEQELGNVNFSNVLKIGIEECMKTLDANGLGEKARDFLSYLSFRSVHKAVLERLLAIEPRSLNFILEVFESNYIIKKQDDLYEYHHQLKRDYCTHKYLSPEMVDDYFIELEMRHKEVMKLEKIDFETFWNIRGSIEDKKRFLHLNNPHLIEKLDFLVFDLCSLEEEPCIVIENYMDIISAEKILDYLVHARLMYDHSLMEDFSEFVKLKDEIYRLAKKKGIDELNPKLLSLKADKEGDWIIYKLISEYSIEMEDYAMFDVLLHSSAGLLQDTELSQEIYDKLDLMLMYYDLTEEALSPLSAVNLSMLHISSILALSDLPDSERYKIRHVDYAQKLFTEPIEGSEDVAALFYAAHLIQLWKANAANIPSWVSEQPDKSINQRIIKAIENLTNKDEKAP